MNTYLKRFAFAMVQFMINLQELDKDLPFSTYPSSTIVFMTMELLCVWKILNSPMNLLKDSGHEEDINYFSQL